MTVTLFLSRLTEVEDQLAKLRSLLETHAPHVDIVQELRETSLSTPSSSMQKEHIPFVARSSSPSRSSRRGSTPYNSHSLPQTPVSQLRHPSLPEAGSLSDGWPNSIPTPMSSSALAHTLPTDSVPRRQTAIIRLQPDPTPASLLPEKQPKTAAGYEWNERAKSARKAGDGTASLSIEPDGEGYLGKFQLSLLFSRCDADTCGDFGSQALPPAPPSSAYSRSVPAGSPCPV